MQASPQGQGLGEATTHLPPPHWLYIPCWGEGNPAMQTGYCSCLLSSLPFLTGILHSANRAICQDRHVAEYNSSLAHRLNGYSKIKHHVSFWGWVWYFPDSSFPEKSQLWSFFCCCGACFLKEYHVHYSSPVTYLEALCVTTYARWLIHFIMLLLYWHTVVSYLNFPPWKESTGKVLMNKTKSNAWLTCQVVWFFLKLEWSLLTTTTW